MRIRLRTLFGLIAVAWFVVANNVNYRWPEVFLYLALWPAGAQVTDKAYSLISPTNGWGHGWVYENVPWLLGFAANALAWAAVITIAVWLLRRRRRRAADRATASV